MTGGHIQARRILSRAIVRTGLACALSSAVAFGDTSSDADAVVLRDGTRLEGKVVEHVPGGHVVLETGGRLRTFSWDEIREVDVAMPPSEEGEPAAMPSEAFTSWDRHRLAYELRASLVGLVSAPRQYEASGSCATGSRLIPVSLYGQSASARVLGSGIGVGARAAYVYSGTPSPSTRFPVWALRAGGGIDLDYLYVHIPTGIPEVSGELCSTVQKRAPSVTRESGSMLLVQVPLQLGAQLGIGSFRPGPSWRGVIIGAAWAPSLTHLEPSAGERSTEVRFFGTEMTADLVTFENEPGPTRPHWRFSLFLSPPSRRNEALILKLGVGAAWY